MEGLTLKGRKAIVTGGAGGIGSQICRDLAELGAEVAVCDINIKGADEVAAEIAGATAFHVDLTSPEDIARFAGEIKSTFGPADVLVNNAGWEKVERFVDTEPATWDRLIAINLRAPIQLTHTLLPGMMERGWGRLVFVSSDAARVGASGEAVYSACKAGLIGFGKTIAREAARSSITSNTVCPGPSDTPLLREVAAENPKLIETLKRAIPLRRLGLPRDISGVVAFLCSERAEYVTGQTVSVNGGLTMV